MTDTAHNVLFIACGSTKHATPAGPVPALDLYAGRQFSLAKRLEAAGWTVVVVSAQHGLVSSDRRLAWYDCEMTAQRSAAAVRNVQTGRSVSAFQFDAMTRGAARVVFYGGERYYRVWEALVGATGLGRSGTGCDVVEIVGAGCGEHYSVLKAIVAEVDAATLPVAA